MRKKQNKKDTKEIAVYSRKSKFTGKGESIENQIDLCLKYIENNFRDSGIFNITVHNFLKESHSEPLNNNHVFHTKPATSEPESDVPEEYNGLNCVSGKIADSNTSKSVSGKSDGFGRNINQYTIRIYEDEGFSGSTLNRPQFKKMMNAAENGELSAIVVYRLDRISRNTADFVSLINRLDSLNIDFISIREQFDTSTPMGRAMMYMSSVFSQLERETIAERIRDNMHELARTGRWLGGVTPTGFASQPYTYIDAQGKTRKACRLTPVPAQLADISSIYNAFLTTASLSRTEALISAAGLRTKTGRPYTRYSIRSILTNPVYAAADRNTLNYLRSLGVQIASPSECFSGNHGLMVYNKTHQQQGRAHKKKPANQWIAAVGQHPATINGANWTAVQNILNKNKTFAAGSVHSCDLIPDNCEYSK